MVGAKCVIGPGCKIYNTTVMEGSKVLGYSLIEGSIIGWSNTVGKWTRISGLTVTGEDVQIKDECFVNGAMITPHKGVTTNLPNAGTIIM